MNYSKHAIKGETMKEMRSDEIVKYGKDGLICINYYFNAMEWRSDLTEKRVFWVDYKSLIFHSRYSIYSLIA